MPALFLGFFMLSVSLFSALSAIYFATWLSRRAQQEGGAPNAVDDVLPQSSSPMPRTIAQSPPDQAIPSPQGVGRDKSENLDFCEILELSPMLVWSANTQGDLIWANRAYLDIARQAVFDAPAENDVPVLFDDQEPNRDSRRCELLLPGQPEPLWFEQYSFPTGSDGRLYFALRADPVVKAEEALQNFVQTLTKTFAHLPIGLAIFDRARRLALFNPALSDLTTIEPDWLTARPTLQAFLDRLREHRHIPEPKDYKTWRDQIANLEQAALDGTYEEHWPLPTGQTYRVTGRPHPEGAVAFLFEDITSSISLQRQFRSELKLGQSVIDAMDEAIAVFSASGELVLSNEAFANVWGIDPREMLSVLSLREAVSGWQDACEATPLWARLTAFFEEPSHRVGGQGRIRTKNGQRLKLRYQPLPAGAVMCRFFAIRASQPQRQRKTTLPR